MSRQRSRVKSTLWWLAVAFTALVVLVASLVPGGVLQWPIDVYPPLRHLLLYGVLSALIVLALRAGWRQALVVVLLLSVAGLGIEFLQTLIPNRSFLWIDAASNVLGALIGAVIGLGLSRWRRGFRYLHVFFERRTD